MAGPSDFLAGDPQQGPPVSRCAVLTAPAPPLLVQPPRCPSDLPLPQAHLKITAAQPPALLALSRKGQGMRGARREELPLQS